MSSTNHDDKCPRVGELWHVYWNNNETRLGLVIGIEDLGQGTLLYESLLETGEVMSLNHAYYLEKIRQ